MLYRKREEARHAHEHDVFARLRYNDLKEAGRAADAGPYANGMELRGGVEVCWGGAAEHHS